MFPLPGECSCSDERRPGYDGIPAWQRPCVCACTQCWERGRKALEKTWQQEQEGESTQDHQAPGELAMALIPGLPRAGSALSCRHGLREVGITSSPWELCTVGWPGKGVRMGSDALELISAERGKKKWTWPFVLPGRQPRHLGTAEMSFQWKQMELCRSVFSFHKGCGL